MIWVFVLLLFSQWIQQEREPVSSVSNRLKCVVFACRPAIELWIILAMHTLLVLKGIRQHSQNLRNNNQNVSVFIKKTAQFLASGFLLKR